MLAETHSSMQRKETLETDQHKYAQLIFDKNAKVTE